ncbi:MAG TPA: alpha/beta hydrolase [Beijerinckiaceae bacterium]|jgi:arylformamidase
MTLADAPKTGPKTEAAAPTGPLVWMEMDQRTLDAAYDQGVWAANQALVAERRAASAAEAHARLSPRRVSYGQTPIEAFDFYACGPQTAPVMVFIHGGAWRAGEARGFAHVADPFLAAGLHVAVLDFINIDDAGGRLETMVEQVRAAVAHIARNAGALAVDAGRIFVAGHSSGAHLSSCVLVTDWEGEHDLPADLLKGVVLMSGMYDLEPVRLSARSRYVNFTDETVENLSAIRHLDRVRCPIVLAYGTQESPEFQRQARDFATALRKAGKTVDVVVAQAHNHFEMLEALHNPHACVGRAALKMIAAARR